jgi:ribose 5-phosphate isomerase B
MDTHEPQALRSTAAGLLKNEMKWGKREVNYQRQQGSGRIQEEGRSIHNQYHGTPRLATGRTISFTLRMQANYRSYLVATAHELVLLWRSSPRLGSVARRGVLTEFLLRELQQRNHEIPRLGAIAEGDAEVDWPQCSRNAAEAVARGIVQEAIVCCWTGTGASIAANKVVGIGAALGADAETAKSARVWNHANVLAPSLPSTSQAVAKEILDAWSAHLIPAMNGIRDKSSESPVLNYFPFSNEPISVGPIHFRRPLKAPTLYKIVTVTEGTEMAGLCPRPEVGCAARVLALSS